MNLLTNNQNLGVLAPILNALKENSFDIKKTLSSINPEILAPLIKQFFENAQNNNPTDTVGQFYYGLEPIKNVADKDIVYTLNKYLGEPIS
ncbi:MAG: hypothetical protein IJV95_03990 [Clostridia bacterium]|nr:hypothetical protein [Clostridia bacterium]